MKKHAWIFALIKTNVKAAMADKGNFAILAIFMTANNLIWFTTWWIFFSITGNIGGWGLQDVARLFGIVAFAYGIGFIPFGGAWQMTRLIADGNLDIHLGRPRSALISLIFSHSEPESLGDALSGIILICTVGNMAPLQVLGAIGLGILSSIIIVSIAIGINSLVFWTNGRTGFADQVFNTFVNVSTLPPHGLPMVIKVLLFTALPAGFVAYLPVEILRDFSWDKLFVMISGVVIFPTLATYIFYQGLKRYTSGNRMLEVR